MSHITPLMPLGGVLGGSLPVPTLSADAVIQRQVFGWRQQAASMGSRFGGTTVFAAPVLVGGTTDDGSNALQVFGTGLILTSAGTARITMKSTTASAAGFRWENTAGAFLWEINSNREMTLTDVTAGPARFFVGANGRLGMGDYFAPSNLPQAGLSIVTSLSVGFTTGNSFSAASGNAHIGTRLIVGSTSDNAVHAVQVTGGPIGLIGGNGSYWTKGSSTELLTLSTSGTTTDTTANLLPANAIIEAVVARVTTTITTATDWQLGDPTTAGRFTAANATMTAGTTDIGLVHIDQAGAAGPRQTAAAKVRVTTTGTPGAGVIRITVYYRAFVAPTS